MKLPLKMRLLQVLLPMVVSCGAWAQGIPMDQWSPQEHEVIEMARKQGMTLTQDQAELTIKSMRDQVARLMGQVAGMQAASRIQIPVGAAAPSPAAIAASPSGQAAVSTTSEAQLAEILAQWSRKPASFSVKGRPDGFDINGQPVLDAEGRIFSYAVNAVTGSATYAVQGSRGVTVKAVAPDAPYPTVTIATGVQGAHGWELMTATGQRVAGDTLTILSDGFMLGRSSAAFRYRTGEGVRNIAIPSGYFLAPLQNGDIGSTGFVLLEKEGAAPATKGNPLLELISATKALGSMIGVGKKEDYALMDMQSGKLVSFNIPADGKTVSLLSDCRKRNWVLNECKKMQTFESVYNPDGFKNNMHYFWKVRWYPTSEGPVALTQEDGVTTIYITDLRTGRKVQAFNRALGIANWDVEQHSNGALGVKAQLAFEWNQIPDVMAYLKEQPAMEGVASSADSKTIAESGAQTQ